jgi:hypothetical protein
MADPCAAQLTAANSCVSGDPGSCSCFTQPFMTSFPTEVTGAYRKTMAFEVPGSPEFCTKANFNVCTQFETTAGCCCGKEITEYTKCTFTSTLNVNFGAVGCEHTSCGGGGEEAAGGGGGSMMIIVVILLLLGCGCGGFYYRRRKRLASLVGKDVDTRVRSTYECMNECMHGWMDVHFLYCHKLTSSHRSLFRSLARPMTLGMATGISSRGIETILSPRKEASILTRNLTVIAPKTRKRRTSVAN